MVAGPSGLALVRLVDGAVLHVAVVDVGDQAIEVVYSNDGSWDGPEPTAAASLFRFRVGTDWTKTQMVTAAEAQLDLHQAGLVRRFLDGQPEVGTE